MLRRFGLAGAPRFLWECLNVQTVSRFPAPRFKPIGPISGNGLTCWLPSKVYGAYLAGWTFSSEHGRRSRQSLYNPTFSYSHCLLDRFQPRPVRSRAHIR